MRMHQVYKLFRRAAATALLPAMAACGEGVGGPSGPLADAPMMQVTGPGGGAAVWVCKLGPAGTTADFQLTVDGPGTLPLGATFTLDAYPECVWDVNTFVVWVAEAPRPDPLVNTTVTVEEVGATPGMELTLIDYAEYLTNTYGEVQPPSSSVTITANYDFGGRIKFTNEGTPPGGDGCTPGYWKQPQHFDSWVTYTQDDMFTDVFGGSTFSGMTLLDVLKQGGGDVNALGRHAVAALLNTANAGVDYDMSTQGVIDAFLAAVGPGGDIEGQKNIFAYMNELGCPLN